MGFHNGLLSCHHFLSTAKNSMSMHTKQGPIRTNLHCPNHWCRFRFVGREAEAFFPHPFAIGKERGDTRGATGCRQTSGVLADRQSPNHINCTCICTSSDTRMCCVHLHFYTHKHTWHLKCTVHRCTANPIVKWGAMRGRAGRWNGWRDMQRESVCWQDCDRA